MFKPFHYTVTVIDSYSAKTIRFTVYGQLTHIECMGSKRAAIVNQYNVPVYISTINTISINKP